MLIITVSEFPAQTYAASLIFRSGFEANSTGIGNPDITDIIGKDNSVMPPNDWVNDLDSHPHIKKFQFSYVCGDASIRKAQIVNDPKSTINPTTGEVNKVLYFWLKDTCHDGAETRVSTGISPEHQLKEFFSRVRMYVHPDIYMLKNHSSGVSNSELNWLQIHEFWARHGSESGNSFRININLRREKDSGNFYWGAEANQNKPTKIVFWTKINKSVPVPFGEWVTTEVYYKMGDNKTGRFIFSIQREGHPKETIFDVTDWTYNPLNSPEGIRTWNPHKLYTDPKNVDFVRNNGGVMQIYWDDWEIWDTIPPSKIQGDLNGDGIINIFDIIKLIQSYDKHCGDNGFNPDADLKPDCTINIFDIIEIIKLF